MATHRTVHDAFELGRAVREARLGKQLSQAALAAYAQVGRQWIVGLELGDKSAAPLDMVMRVLRALDLTIGLEPAPRGPLIEPPVISASQILRQHTQER